MRTAIVTAALSLLLGACTSVQIVVTAPIPLNVNLEQVKGSKIIFSVNPENQDATYGYSICSEEGDIYPLGYREQALATIKLWEDSEYNKSIYSPSEASFQDMYFYRGSRTIRINNLRDDKDYKLIVFQVDPLTHEILGDVYGQQIHTLRLEKKDLTFTFQTQGEVITIIPSDPERIYYWDFDPIRRIYDNYFWPTGFLYDLLEMYDQYGFSKEVYSVGAEQYDFSRHHLVDGEEYLLVASACEDGEITSQVTVLDFSYTAGSIQIIQQEEE